MSSLSEFEISYVTSADQAKIGYRQIGTGPGVILVHGGMQSSLNFTSLAKALSAHFTVYLPDRRGRGLSGTYGNDHGLLSEANDLLALVRYTGAANIFGLSAGAIVTLQAALLEPALKKVALFEPPIQLDPDTFKQLDRDYENAMREENLGKAFIAILKGTGDTGFSPFNILPGFITAPLVNIMIRSQMKSRNEDEIPLHELIPTFHYERTLIENSKVLIDKAKNIRADVLLLGGSKSQKYFRPVLQQLYDTIPNARRIEFENSGHIAADNSESPLKVASELLSFFKG